MPFTASKQVPPTRHTGDTPVGGVAADINALTAAVAEIQAGNLLVADASGRLPFAQLPTQVLATYATLTDAQNAGVGGQLAVGQVVQIGSLT